MRKVDKKDRGGMAHCPLHGDGMSSGEKVEARRYGGLSNLFVVTTVRCCAESTAQEKDATVRIASPRMKSEDAVKRRLRKVEDRLMFWGSSGSPVENFWASLAERHTLRWILGLKHEPFCAADTLVGW